MREKTTRVSERGRDTGKIRAGNAEQKAAQILMRRPCIRGDHSRESDRDARGEATHSHGTYMYIHERREEKES